MADAEQEVAVEQTEEVAAETADAAAAPAETGDEAPAATEDEADEAAAADASEGVAAEEEEDSGAAAAAAAEEEPKVYEKGEHPGLDMALGDMAAKRTGSKGRREKKDMSAHFDERGFRIMKQDERAMVTGFDLYGEEEQAKREARIKKYGVVKNVHLEEEDTEHSSLSEREKRAAKFGVPLRDNEMKWCGPRALFIANIWTVAQHDGLNHLGFVAARPRTTATHAPALRLTAVPWGVAGSGPRREAAAATGIDKILAGQGAKMLKRAAKLDETGKTPPACPVLPLPP